MRVITRVSNNAGGLEGGMTNGMPLVIRAAMKPIPTLTTPLRSVELPGLTAERGPFRAERCLRSAGGPSGGRGDDRLRAGGAYLEKFGGDNVWRLPRVVDGLQGAPRKQGTVAPFVACPGSWGAARVSVGELPHAPGLEFVDLDAEIVDAEGMPIAEFFAEHGEPDFRRREFELLRPILEEAGFDSRAVWCSLWGEGPLKAARAAAC